MRATGPAALLALACVAGCGGESKYKGRTAPEWAHYLWDPDVKVAGAALDALAAFAEKRPDDVLAALESTIQTPPPGPTDSPFSFTVDTETAALLGLDPIPPSDAANADLPTLRGRILALGAQASSLRALPDGSIDVVLTGGRARAELERIQRVFATRGALDLRVVVPDPASGPGGLAARAVVYDDKTMSYADRLSAETKRDRDARAAHKRYRPETPRWRAVARADGADYVLVEEPKDENEALDDRMVLGAHSVVTAAGKLVVALDIRQEHRAAWHAFVQRNAGLRMAVIVDDVLLGATPIPSVTPDRVELGLWPSIDEDAKSVAADLAIVLAAGRLPRPLAAIPIPTEYGADPAPDNNVARAFLALRERSIPVLERVAKSAPLAWSRESANWALDRLKPR